MEEKDMKQDSCDLLTLSEAAALLNVDEVDVLYYIKYERLPAIQLGRFRFLKRENVLRWQKERKADSPQ
jgi:excisionase family DNA binding protein